MAIAYDNDTDGQATSSGTLSYSHTCTGSGLVLVVGITWAHASGRDVSTVTYNSVSMTKAVDRLNGDGSFGTSVWYLANPALGSNTLTITMDYGVTGLQANATSFTGCDVDDPIGATNTAANLSVAVTTDTDNSFVYDTVFNLDPTCNTNPLTVGAGQTDRANHCNNHREACSTEPTTTAGSVTMDWSGTGDNALHSVLEIHEAQIGATGGVIVF